MTAGTHAFPKHQHLNLQHLRAALSHKNTAAATKKSSYKHHFALLALCTQRGTGGLQESVVHTPANSQLHTPYNISAVPLLVQNIPSIISTINEVILIMYSQPLPRQGEALEKKNLCSGLYVTTFPKQNLCLLCDSLE